MQKPGKWLWVALALALIQGILLTHTVMDKSDTIDEWQYLHRSVQQWEDDRFYCSSVLPQWGFAAALNLVGDPRATGPSTARASRVLQRNLVVARLSTVVVVVAGGLLLWAAARRFGESSAVLAHGLWCFSPTLLAHGALATFDGWTAAACAGGLLAMLRWREEPTVWRSSVLGIALAVATASKLVALGLLLPTALIAVLFLRSHPRRSSWLSVVLPAAAAMFVTLWTLYGFDVAALNTRDLCGTGRASSWLPALSVSLPLSPLWESILIQLEHGFSWGHTSYLFGETARDGWWWFYLACIAFQTTVGAQGLALLRILILVAHPARQALKTDAVLLAFPLLLFVLLSAGKTQRGLQYLLPVYPFVIMFVAGIVSEAPKYLGKRMYYVTGILAAAAFFESIYVHPHHLMFYNAWAGGPTGGPFYLIAGNDLGQDKRRLALWQERRGIPEVYYLPYGGQTARLWGVAYRQPTECRPRPGVYALHAATLHKPHPAMRGCLDWLTRDPPDNRLGYSIYIYYVDAARIKRLTESTEAEPFLQTGPTSEQ